MVTTILRLGFVHLFHVSIGENKNHGYFHCAISFNLLKWKVVDKKNPHKIPNHPSTILDPLTCLTLAFLFMVISFLSFGDFTVTFISSEASATLMSAIFCFEIDHRLETTLGPKTNNAAPSKGMTPSKIIGPKRGPKHRLYKPMISKIIDTSTRQGIDVHFTLMVHRVFGSHSLWRFNI